MLNIVITIFISPFNFTEMGELSMVVSHGLMNHQWNIIWEKVCLFVKDFFDYVNSTDNGDRYSIIRVSRKEVNDSIFKSKVWYSKVSLRPVRLSVFLMRWSASCFWHGHHCYSQSNLLVGLFHGVLVEIPQRRPAQSKIDLQFEGRVALRLRFF